MGFLRKWLGMVKSAPEVERDETGRALPAAVLPCGYVVFHVPAGVPAFDEAALDAIASGINAYTEGCRFPLHVVVVQAQIEGVA